MEVAIGPAGASRKTKSVRRVQTGKPPSHFGDRAFEWLTLAMALAVVVLVFLVGWQLARGSSLAIKRFGFSFFITSTWDPVAEHFGACRLSMERLFRRSSR